MAAVVLPVLLLAAAFLYRRRRGREEAAPTSNDLNPVYGLYYHDGGARVDYWESEAVDGNDYYE